MERRIYQPKPSAVHRRTEWVEMPDGSSLCIWEMTVAEITQMLERSARPAIDPRGGQDASAAVIYQILLSCYDGEPPVGKLIFGAGDLAPIGALTFEEFELVMAAINRVNGKDANTEEVLRDFSAATGALNSSGSPTSASKNSGGSRKKLTSPSVP